MSTVRHQVVDYFFQTSVDLRTNRLGGGMDGGAGGVTDTQLELPFNGPTFRLFVLAQLEQNLVLAWLEFGIQTILIHLHAAVILIATK